jgi:hypothetical protein
MAAQAMKHHLHIGHFHLGDFDTTFEMIASIFLSLLIIIPVMLFVIIFGILFLNWLIY